MVEFRYKENPKEVDNAYETADIFLQGSCDVFARLLHERYRYPIYTITSAEGGYHIFCKWLGMYIDVRGKTGDVMQFISGLVGSYKEGVEITPASEDDVAPDTSNEDLTDGEAFAEYVFNLDPERYRVG